MGKSLCGIVGGLMGGATGHLLGLAYEIPLYAAFGPAGYVGAVALGAIGGAVFGESACNYKSK